MIDSQTSPSCASRKPAWRTKNRESQAPEGIPIGRRSKRLSRFHTGRRCVSREFGNPKARAAVPKASCSSLKPPRVSAGLRSYTRDTQHLVSSRRSANKHGKLVKARLQTKIPYVVTSATIVSSGARHTQRPQLPRASHNHTDARIAIFAYHCGEGCAAELQRHGKSGQVRSARERPSDVLLGESRLSQLFEALQFSHAARFLTTYWFRVMRAEQLLKLYERDPMEFQTLFNDYRNVANPRGAPITAW